MRRTVFITTMLLGLTVLPSVVQPAELSPRELAAANKAAMGGERWDDVRALASKGELELGDLTGEFSTVTDFAGMRLRSDATIGPMQQHQVITRDQVLMQDQAGQVIRLDAPADVRGSLSELYRAVEALWYPERWSAGLERLADVEEDGRSFARLTVEPREAQPFEVWIDLETRLTDRVIERSGATMVTTRLGDYQATEGLMFPRRIEVNVEGGSNTQILRIKDVEINPEFDDDTFVLVGREADDYRIADGADTVVVPFELFNNHTYIQAFINGEGPFQFLVDTGGRHLLTPQVAEAVGIETQGEFDIGGAGAKRRTASLASVDRLRVGTLELVDQPFIVLDMSELSSVGGARIDGLIGYEVFRRFVVEYDYADREIRLHRPERFEYDGEGYVVPFRFNHTTPLIRGSIDGHEGDITIDTGSRSHLSLTTPFAREHGYADRHPDAPTTIIGWGVGGPIVGQVARGSRLRIGDELVVDAPLIDFSNETRGALANPDEIANLGAGILQQFTLILDYANREITFVPNGRFGTRESNDRAGLFLREVESGFEVAHVTPGGPADRAGIEAGHVITAIDGKAAADILLPRLRQEWRSEPAGTVYRLTVMKGTGENTAELVLEDLVP